MLHNKMYRKSHRYVLHELFRLDLYGGTNYILLQVKTCFQHMRTPGADSPTLCTVRINIQQIFEPDPC